MPDTALFVLDGYFNDNLTISIISKIEVLGFNDNEVEMKRLADFIALATFFLLMMLLPIKPLSSEKSIKLNCLMLLLRLRL